MGGLAEVRDGSRTGDRVNASGRLRNLAEANASKWGPDALRQRHSLTNRTERSHVRGPYPVAQRERHRLQRRVCPELGDEVLGVGADRVDRNAQPLGDL